MKRIPVLLAAVLMLAFASVALAGEYGQCTASAQECLDHMSESFTQTGWAGLDGEYNEEHGYYTVTSLVSYGPAEKAGIKVADVLFGINGHKFSEMDEAAWKAMKGERTPGATVTYMVKRDGEKTKVDIVLAEMPKDVMATKLGSHMLEHATVASVQ